MLNYFLSAAAPAFIVFYIIWNNVLKCFIKGGFFFTYLKIIYCFLGMVIKMYLFRRKGHNIIEIEL